MTEVWAIHRTAETPGSTQIQTNNSEPFLAVLIITAIPITIVAAATTGQPVRLRHPAILILTLAVVVVGVGEAAVHQAEEAAVLAAADVEVNLHSLLHCFE